MLKHVLRLALTTAFGLAAAGALAGTLADIKERDVLRCGVSQGVPGFSNVDSNENWAGLDVDFCRAVAAAVLGDADKTEFVQLSALDRFEALTSGQVDLLSSNSTWTMGRDTRLGVHFAGILYYDGQGFMVRKDLGMTTALELSGSTVCTTKGTTTELNVSDYFNANNMPYEVVAFENADEVVQAYDAGKCVVFTSDAAALYAQRLKLTNPRDHMVLPEIISKEPLGPVVRQGDDEWFNTVKWTLYAMINAEELGVSSENIAEHEDSANPAVKRLLGKEGAFGEGLGLTSDWAHNVISQVGNYAEIFERNVGPDSQLGIARGVNALWSDGGLLYAPPIR